MPDKQPQSVPQTALTQQHLHFDDDLAQLRRRLFRDAMLAVEMLENAIRGLWPLDTEVAEEVRAAEQRVDDEEVAIEKECLRLMTLQQPFGSDFRFLAFCLKVNADIECVADHADAIAKITLRPLPSTGTHRVADRALTELGERLPMLCHRLLRAVLDQDAEGARALVGSDEVIDALDKRLFRELAGMTDRGSLDPEPLMLLYRIGRELERVGDLMCNIAEDVVYLETGEIIRHAKRRARVRED